MARRGKKKGRPVSGWVVLDKPVGMGSTEAVSKVKWLFQAEKAGHAGTLDPLASGMLPIALGEATKTVPYVRTAPRSIASPSPGARSARPTISKGRSRRRSDLRPDEAAIRALLPKYTGVIMQTPPQFSAIKIAGERAYDLARDGETVEIPPREVEIGRFDLIELRRGRPHRVRDRMRQGHLCALAGPRHGPRPRLLRPYRRICAGSRSSRSRQTISSPSTSSKPRASAQPRTGRAEVRADCDRFAAIDALLVDTAAALDCLPQVAITDDAASRSGSATRSSFAAATRRWRPRRPAPRRAAGWWRSARSKPACSSRSGFLQADENCV